MGIRTACCSLTNCEAVVQNRCFKYKHKDLLRECLMSETCGVLCQERAVCCVRNVLCVVSETCCVQCQERTVCCVRNVLCVTVSGTCCVLLCQERAVRAEPPGEGVDTAHRRQRLPVDARLLQRPPRGRCTQVALTPQGGRCRIVALIHAGGS